MKTDWIQLVVGFMVALAISLAAKRAHSLSRSGAAAATLLGTVIFGLGGFPWAVIMMVFFITSSALSRVFGKRKAGLNEKFSKGSERDAAQVLANGGIAGVFALLHAFFPDSPLMWLGFCGALAGANADTWATELGVLSRAGAVLITTGKPVERGTSGGISWFGTLAAFSGALLVALFSTVLWGWATGLPDSLMAGVLRTVGLAAAGLLGSLVDSLIGATIQAIYTCPNCQKETERHPLHSCGTPTTLVRGLPWMDNDWVNISCTVVSGGISLVLSLI
jgi:uncharacterized protein (TIGR00297 family)